MARGLYFDCFAGASGDMIVGALIDCGLDFEELKSRLATLNLAGYRLRTERIKKGEIAATRFVVECDDRSQPARRLKDVCEVIAHSSLSEAQMLAAIHIFERLAEAEARVHQTSPHKVHFHEVGAVDSIIDVVGAVVGFDLLGVDRFVSSPLRVGFGTVRAAHGLLPVPAPGTAELLKGAPVYSGEVEGEFVTPTGAAIVTALCADYGRLPRCKIVGTGYGAGARDHKELPNVLRLFLFEGEEAELEHSDSVMVVETNIDDMNPQVYGFVMRKAFEAGALDFFIIPAQMKKDRPGALITILCRPEDLDVMTGLLMSETTTLGVRYYESKRRVAEREVETVETRYGPIRIKVARRAGLRLHFQAEYDDCARAAREANIPLIEVQRAAESAYAETISKREED
jgi:uncharacterized protein (TIGR00299 family) protein